MYTVDEICRRKRHHRWSELKRSRNCVLCVFSRSMQWQWNCLGKIKLIFVWCRNGKLSTVLSNVFGSMAKKRLSTSRGMGTMNDEEKYEIEKLHKIIVWWSHVAPFQQGHVRERERVKKGRVRRMPMYAPATKRTYILRTNEWVSEYMEKYDKTKQRAAKPERTKANTRQN